MSVKEIWTDAKKTAAEAGRYYIKADGKSGHLKLSGSKLKWKNVPTFTYVPSLRVAGTPTEIVALLTGMGNEASAAREYVASGYNADSLENADYLAELADLKTFNASGKTAAKRAVAAAPVNSIAWYAQQVEEAKVQGTKAKSPSRKKSASPKKKSAKKAKKTASPKKAKKTASPKKAKKTKTASPKKAKKTKTASPKKRASPKRAKKSLADKLESLAEGKVLDVSAYRASDNKSTIIAAPGAKSKKVVVGRISANPDALAGVKAAAKDLGDDNLVALWKAARSAEKTVSPKSPRSPATPLPLSPSSPRSPRGLPVRTGSPRSGGSALPSLPVARVPTIGSPRSPRI